MERNSKPADRRPARSRPTRAPAATVAPVPQTSEIDAEATPPAIRLERAERPGHRPGGYAGAWCLLVVFALIVGPRPVVAQGPAVPCSDGAPHVLCLNGDRFEVVADWRTAEESGLGTARELTADTGYFWFFRETNVEVVVKVLDGCAVNGHFWVFAGGLTDVEMNLSVRDAGSGFSRDYSNPAGTAFVPRQDTAAFPCRVENPPPGTEVGIDWSRDTLVTDLVLDLATRRGTARLTLAGDDSGAASFAIGDLEVESVSGPGGAVTYRISEDSAPPSVPRHLGRRLDVALPATAGPVTLEVDYGFSPHDDFDGYMAGSGTSFLWPYFCGNLFPCDPDPADGFELRLEVTGLPAGAPPGTRVVAPAAVPFDGPPYMPGLAVGDYTFHDLGESAAGTRVGLWSLPAGEAAALAAAADLADVFGWFEATYGPYPFGDEVASVVVDWSGVAGGMEHHPYWHVAVGSADDPVAHAHEAAHGWFGNGVRIACWEDFVLSEGLATYLAARSLEAVRGAAAGDDVWRRYRVALNQAVARGDTVARPQGCGSVDLLTTRLWSGIPYYKGAFFLRAFEQQAGRAEIDAALAGFFADHAGRAATVTDLLATLELETGVDPMPLAEDWLLSPGVPDS